MSLYGHQPKKIQAGKANENGDVEQSHRRLKESVDRAVRLRGSRDFGCVEDCMNHSKGRCCSKPMRVTETTQRDLAEALVELNKSRYLE